MSITSLQICLSQVAKACKDAVAERGAFALAIPGGSILKVPLVRVTLWGSSAKMTKRLVGLVLFSVLTHEMMIPIDFYVVQVSAATTNQKMSNTA